MRSIHVTPQVEDYVTPKADVTVIPEAAAQANVTVADEVVVTVDHNAPIPEENHDPMHRAIWHVGAYPPLERILRRVCNFIGDAIKLARQALHWLHVRNPMRKRSDEELRELAELRERKALSALLESEAKLAERRIINCLTRINICYRFKKSEQDFFVSGVQEVQILRASLADSALYFHIDTDHLPRGVVTTQITSPETLTELSLACGKTVSADYDTDHGLILIMSRSGNANGIPEEVNYTHIINDIPENRDPFTIPIGVGQNGRRHYASFSDMVHMLVAGTTGSGKSTFLHGTLLSLAQRVSPEMAKFILVDLKGGMEFNFYTGLPHLLQIPQAPTGIIDNRDAVLPVVMYLIEEGEKRMAILKKDDCQNIGQYNRGRRKKIMPHIFFVVDEYADIKLDPQLGRDVEDMLVNVASRMRAVGIHIIICTQTPKSEVINTRIKGVLEARVAFNCPSGPMSMTILDSYAAHNLKPVGRAVFSFKGELQVQTPKVQRDQIRQIVADLRDGKLGVITRQHDVTFEEIAENALRNDNGYISADRLYMIYKNRGISRDELRELITSHNGEEFIMGMTPYTLILTSNKGYRVVAKDSSNDQEHIPAAA